MIWVVYGGEYEEVIENLTNKNCQVCLDCFEEWLYEDVKNIKCTTNKESGKRECDLKGNYYCKVLCGSGGYRWWEKLI